MKGADVDCSSGAAGDMLLGALVDAGAPQQTVKRALESLRLEGWSLYFENVTRCSLAATKANVLITQDRRRSYGDIVRLLNESGLDEPTKQRALNTFECLATAEASVHGTGIEDVHLHEVGSTDAIIDIVGCSAALESLKVDRIVVSPIATGTGSVSTEHGEFPLPVPAVVEMLRGREAALFGRGHSELVTPTGAAILVTAASKFASMPPLHIEAVGHGAGDRDLEWPNVVRVLVGLAAGDSPQATHALIVEANIDDMSPELLPHAIDALMGAGAQDAWVTPIVMKKGRPGFLVSALCSPADEHTVVEIFFKETTTLNLRITEVAKKALEREWVSTTVEGLPVRVKVGRKNGAVTTVAPEHDDALEVSRVAGLSLKEVYARATEDAKRSLLN